MRRASRSSRRSPTVATAPGRGRRWRAPRSPERPRSCASVIRPGPCRSLKAALIGSGDTVRVGGQPAPPTRGGGGLVNPARADVPLIARQAGFALVRPRAARASALPLQLDLSDAGAGAGVWDVAVETVSAGRRRRRSRSRRPSSVPGIARDHRDRRRPDAADGDFSGFIRLTRGTDVRRVPFWLHVTRPALGAARPARSHRASASSPATRRESLARVSRYRYPGGSRRRPGDRSAPGAGAGLPVRSDATGRELRRRHHAPRRRACASSPGSSLRETRTGSRATPHFRSTSTPISRSSASPCSWPAPFDRSRGATTSSSTARRPPAQGLRVPLLGRRHATAVREARPGPCQAQARRSRPCLGRGLRRRPGHGGGDDRREGPSRPP